MTDVLTTVEEVKSHAERMELAGVSFWDGNGQFVEREMTPDSVGLSFIDGTKALLTWDQFQEFADFEFKLRPVDAH